MKHPCPKQKRFSTHKEMIVNFHNTQKSPLEFRGLKNYKQMKKTLLFYIVLCFCVTINAQTNSSLKIIVTDSLTRTPVPFASVLLKNMSHKMVDGASSGDKGDVTFTQLTDSVYHVQITAVGYEKLETTIRTAMANYNLELRPSNVNLQEVAVVGTVKAFEQKYDRKVYTIKEAQKATSRTVLDLLKTMPGVIVNDEDKSIMYRGATPELQVNDMPAFMLYPDISVIPAERVKKIELIDASNRGGGVLGGIINIILVKREKDGLDGFLSSEVKQAEISHSFGQEHALNLNFGKGKNIYYGNFLLANRYNHDLNHQNGYVENSITGKENILQLDTTKRNNNRFQAFLGAMRMVDTLRTDFYIIGIAKEKNSSQINRFYSRGVNDYFYNMRSNENIYGFGGGYGIVKNFKKPYKTLQTMVYLNLPIRIKTVGQAKYTYPNSNAVLNVSSLAPTKGSFGMFSFYFNNPLESGWNFSLSEQSQFGTRDFYTDRLRNGIVDTLNLTRDKLVMWQDNLSVNFGRMFGQFRIEAGLSFNHSYNRHNYNRYMVVERDTNFVLQKHYFSLNPSVNFNWHVNETHDLSLKYAYSRVTPNIDDLTDYIDKRSVYNWTTGNPDLKSTNYHNLAIGYTFSKEKFNISTELVYKQSDNTIIRVGYYLPDNIRLSKPVNVGSTKEFGMVFTNWIQISPKVSMTNSATLNYKNLDQSNLKKEANAFGLEGEQFVFTQFNYDLSSYTTWTINSRNFASLRLNYYSKSLQYYGYRKPWLGSSLNYTLKLLENDRLKLMFGIDNLTAGLIDRVAVNNNMGTYTTSYEDPSSFRRTYKVALTYMINNGDKGTKNLKF